MNFKYLIGIFCIMLLILPTVFAGDLMVLHGKAYDGNYLMATGDIRAQIYIAPTGGSPIYDSLTDFNGAINNGLFDVLLGSGVSLDLNLGQRYYYAMQINAKDINFGTSLRQVFQSAHGDLNAYNISDLNNNVGYITAAALNPYLTKVDANGFYAFKTDVNLWTNQLLVPYLTKSDANGFYALKSDVNIWTQQLLVPYTLKSDTNVWIVQKLAPYLLQVDANGFFAFKTDVNLWTNQLLAPYLLQTDANGFYALKNDVNVWTNQLLVPYLLKSDANIWTNQLILSSQADSNNWVLTKLDGNALYALKWDVNVWIDQKLVPYLTQVDANGFYPLKTDVNIWASQLDVTMETDANKWNLTKLDANALYPLKWDINVWIGQLDTNWQTSFGLFDSNMRATYATLGDVNTWAGQLDLVNQADYNIWYLTKLDANGFYALKTDVNVWTNQLLVPYLSKVDANGFYPLKGDVNTWINQIAVPYTGADRDVNLGTHGIAYYDINWTGGRVFSVPLDGNIQSFIDNAISGDTLLLGSGTYTITSAIRVDKTLNIRGQGNVKIYNATADVNIFYITADNSKISDLNIFDIGAGTKAIFINNANNITIRNVTINTTGDGFEYGVYSLNASGNILNSVFTINSTDQNSYGINLLNNASAAQDQNWLIENTLIYVNGIVRAKGIIINNQNSSYYITANIVNSQINAQSVSNFSTYGLETTSTTTANARAYVYNSTIGGELTDVNGVRLNTIYLYATTLLNGTIGGDVHYLGTATANTIYFDTNGILGSYQEGKMFYDPTWKTLSVQIGRDVTLQVGQEELTRIYNNTGSTIVDGKAVFVTGVYITGDNNVPTVALANASTDANAQVFGITTQSIPNNDYGFITIRGYINDLNTEDASWNIGDTLYLSDTISGDLTNVVPTNSTSLQVKIGTLITKSPTAGRINVRLVPVLKLDNLANVTITNPVLDQVLKFNGVNWVNGAASTVSGSNGIAFYPDSNDINLNTNQNFFGIESLYKYPITTTPQTAETLIATAGLSPVEPYIYNTDLNRTLIDAGTWTFNMFLGANRIDRNPYLFNIIYKIRQYNPTDINITTDGTGATRYVIASSGAPFSTALIDTNFTANDQNLYAGYLQTPKGAYKVVGRTSDTNITISTPTTYVNETAVKFYTWKRLFMARSQIINNVTPAYTLYSISSSQGAFDMNLTDRIGMMIVAVASNTTSITYVYNGSTYYSYFNTPLITLHNNLAGLQGGSADEYYHLTQAQFIIATQSATGLRNGYLTSVDWTAFNNKANMTDLNAYTLRTDTNIWASQLDAQRTLDYNGWFLTKVDGNALYPLKTDVNTWTNQLLVPYQLKSDANVWANQLIISAQIDSNKWSLTKVDGNALYTLKADTNIWASQLDMLAQLDSNKWSLTKLDANGFYVLKSDANVWTSQLIVASQIDMNAWVLTKVDANALYALKGDVNTWIGQLDTNWETSWGVLDANLKLTYTQLADTNIWIDQKIAPYLLQVDANGFYTLKADTNIWASQLIFVTQSDSNQWALTKLDANGFYALKTDVNVWTNQLLVPYLTKTDANGFFPLKSDVNTWANQLIFVAQTDSNKWTLTKLDANGFYALKTDINVWTNQLLVPYLTKVDANGFYTLKTDTNIWANQLIFIAQSDSNKWSLTKLDANALFALKTDVNVWTNQLLVPYLTKVDANGFYTLKTDSNIWANQLILAAQIDSNKWTLTKLDGNALYALKTDVNTWINQLILSAQTDSNKWSLSKIDANGFYPLKADVNIWTNQLLTPYLSKVDANGFYPLKADVNIWANQLILSAQVDSNKWALSKIDANGFYVLKSDLNADINAALSLQSCPAGQALRSLGGTPVCISVSGGGFSNPATTDLNMNFYNIFNVTTISDSNKYGEFITVSDSSSFGRNASVDMRNNKHVLQVVGKLNEGATLDTSSTAVQIDDVNYGFIVDAFTVSSWVKTTSTASNLTIFNAYAGGGLASYLNFLGATGKASIVYYIAGPIYVYATSDKNVNDGNWHLITGTWNGTNLVLYVDGNVDANVVTGNTPLSPNVATTGYIGQSAYIGLLDDIGVWSRALTPAQVSTLWNSGNGSAINNSDTNLQFVYHLDDLTRNRVDFPTGINAVDLNVGDIYAENVTSGNLCYSDGTNCIALNPFDQLLNSDSTVGFDSVTSENDISTNSGIYYAQSNAGLSDCYDSSLGGQVCSTGGIVTTITDDPSDLNFKINLKPLSLDVNNFSALAPSEWDWNSKSLINKSGPGYGLVAQDLEKIYPQLVKMGQKIQVTGYKIIKVSGIDRNVPVWTTIKYKTIDYVGLITLQIKEIQDIASKNNKLISDVNIWTNQLLVPYLLKSDANNFYAYKTDVNALINRVSTLENYTSKVADCTKNSVDFKAYQTCMGTAILPG